VYFGGMELVIKRNRRRSLSVLFISFNVRGASLVLLVHVIDQRPKPLSATYFETGIVSPVRPQSADLQSPRVALPLAAALTSMAM
jgi:hypothetical protein